MNLRTRPSEEPELNLVPMIDVVLLLLIFFMVSTTFVDESRIKIQLPQSSNEPVPPQRDPIEITVTASGEYRLNDQTLINTSAQTLSAALSKLAGEERDTPITIRADAKATHQSVVTAMDVVGRLGFRAINIATVHESQGADGR